jgi:cytochrome bd-type quinol oxidase subunit 2
MEDTDERLAPEDIKADFARRKRKQFIVMVPLLVLIVGFVLFDGQIKSAASDVPQLVLLGVVAVAAITIMVFSFRNWRCPACNGYLGKSASLNHCPKCGVALR